MIKILAGRKIKNRSYAIVDGNVDGQRALHIPGDDAVRLRVVTPGYFSLVRVLGLKQRDPSDLVYKRAVADE